MVFLHLMPTSFAIFVDFSNFRIAAKNSAKKWKKPSFSFNPTDVHVVFFPSLNAVSIIIYLKWIMHYLAIYLVLFRAFVIATMRKSIRGNSNLQNWVENGLKFFFSMFNVEKCVSSGRKNSDNHLYPHSQLSIQEKVL